MDITLDRRQSKRLGSLSRLDDDGFPLQRGQPTGDRSRAVHHRRRSAVTHEGKLVAGFGDVSAEGERITKEIVLIATGSHFEDLRGEMVRDLVMKEFTGKRQLNRVETALLSVTVIQLLASTIEVLADEIAGVKP
jgi:hypothetical protein